MNIAILAEATTKTATKSQLAWLHFPQHVPAQVDLITWAQSMGPGMAATLILGGLVYLLFGIYIYRILITLNATAVGIFLGGAIGERLGNSAAGALVGGFSAAAITWPTMKYSVAVQGGIFGALLGASVWRSVGLEPTYAWAGGMSGMIFFGMLSFILFRGSIMMYTSLQGSVMLVFGLLGLLFKYQNLAPKIGEGLSLRPFLLPISIFIPTVVGLIYQQAQYGEPAPAAKK